MTRRLAFPAPPDEYDRDYFDRIISLLNEAETRLQNLGDVGMDTFHLRECPNDGSLLRAGDVYNEDGVLKIVRTDDVLVGGLFATSGLGSVTVTTS